MFNGLKSAVQTAGLESLTTHKRLRITTLAAACCLSVNVFAECEDQGGPGYRAQNGKCVGWETLARSCGNPPTLRCKSERVHADANTAANQGSNIRGFMDAAHSRVKSSGTREANCNAAKDPDPEVTLMNSSMTLSGALAILNCPNEQFDRLLRDGKKSLIENYYVVRKLDEQCEQRKQ